MTQAVAGEALADAGIDARLAEERCLLVTGDAGDGDCVAMEGLRARDSQLAAAGGDRGKRTFRHSEELEQLWIPGLPTSNRIVREAFDGSVAASPVSLNVSQASIVPNIAWPCCALSRSPVTF